MLPPLLIVRVANSHKGPFFAFFTSQHLEELRFPRVPSFDCPLFWVFPTTTRYLLYWPSLITPGYWNLKVKQTFAVLPISQRLDTQRFAILLRICWGVDPVTLFARLVVLELTNKQGGAAAAFEWKLACVVLCSLACKLALPKVVKTLLFLCVCKIGHKRNRLWMLLMVVKRAERQWFPATKADGLEAQKTPSSPS